MLLLCVLFLLPASRVDAFGITPTKFYVTVDPGTKQQVDVVVENTDAVAKKYRIFVLGVEQDEKGHPTFKKNGDQALAWVTSPLAEVQVKPKSERKVPFNISVPVDAQPGAHYLGLTVEESNQNAGGLGISGRLVSLLTLQIAGIAKEDVTVNKWQSKRSIYYKKSLLFDLGLRNNGTIDVAMKSNIVVRNWLGNVISDFEFPLGNRLIAGAERNMQVPVEIERFFPGLYQVEAKITFGRIGQSVVRVDNILYLPLAGTLVFLFSMGVLIIIFIKLYRRLKKHV